MSLGTIRGGIPRCIKETIDTTGRKVAFPFFSNYMILRVATSPALLYFTEADFTNGVNAVTVPVAAADAPYGEWQGPVEAKEVWIKGSGGNTAIELVVFQRRG
jgi:hypothetical protein